MSQTLFEQNKIKEAKGFSYSQPTNWSDFLIVNLSNVLFLCKLMFSSSLCQSCWNCGRKASETCSGCNTARYCGSFCQHKDWEKHHHVCGQTLQAQQQQAGQQQGSVPGSETPAPISSSACTPSSGTGSPAATPPAATPRSSTPSTPSSSALDGTPR